MHSECYPISVLPHASRLFLQYLEQRDALTPFYPISPHSTAWMARGGSLLSGDHRNRLVELLASQNRRFAAGSETFANLERLTRGAPAVVTGQQVGLLGGPLYTLLKAATAVRLAADATAAGHPTVPIFWMATEDHDFAEVDHVLLPDRHALHTLRLQSAHPPQAPVGAIPLGAGIESVLAEAAAILGPSAFVDRLRDWYRPEETFAGAFAKLIAAAFARYGLIVIDASTQPFHRLGSEVLRHAILEADALHEQLTARDWELAAHGYHSQVLVAPDASLLFLLDAQTGARTPLRRAEGEWKAGSRRYRAEELLAILEEEPERLSPNALLRSVFQDAILPTSAYVGGPAEIAYFAQSEVLYRGILGRVTPVLPRLSATLVEPAIATVMARHELSLPDAFLPAGELAQRLGARSLPVEAKQRLASAGNALDHELAELTSWMAAADEGLGRSAAIAASKMRYQMNRLRRLAATHQLERESSLERHASAIAGSLYPTGHPQERVLGAAYFLARYEGSLVQSLVEAAGPQCPGHRVLFL